MTGLTGAPLVQVRRGVEATTRLELIALALTIGSMLVRIWTKGESTAMFASIMEDATEMLAPVAVLLTFALEGRPATPLHPFGYQRIGSLSFLVAALALLALGTVVGWDAMSELMSGVEKHFGNTQILGWEVWQGWVMIVILFVTSLVMVPVATTKIRLVREVQLEALKADMLSNISHIVVAWGAALGIFLTRFGWGWADPLMALVIGLAIFWEGYRQLRGAVSELIDIAPDPVVMEHLSQVVTAKPWVRGHYWLARKDGRFID
ncbi:MAG: cation diffusion facilitator family transporter, partial [Chloroflexi bacterium]|nr:cation diffusion facilitator family transporter [Chloroflexota bacterium]